MDKNTLLLIPRQPLGQWKEKGNKKTLMMPGTMAHIFNLSTPVAEAGRSPCSGPARPA